MQLLCPACAVVAEHRTLFVKNGCEIVRCTGCGLGRALARDFQPEQYYTGEYFSGGQADGYADYRGSEPILRREFTHTVDFIRRHRPDGRLLDIGCAYGFFLNAAEPFYQVSGIEIAADAAEFCRARGLHVITGKADQETLAGLGTFDVMVLLDVIEHLPDPRQTLSLCHQHLSPNGIIVITTGDFASLGARLAGRNWRLMTPPQHLWFFTPASIGRLSQSLGLALESCDHPWKLVPLSLVTFQLRRILGAKPTMPSREAASACPLTCSTRCVAC